MNTCTKCKLEKPDTDFQLEKNRKGERVPRAQCRECRKSYLRGYYVDNAEYFSEYRSTHVSQNTASATRANRRKRHEHYAAIQELKSGKPCLDCGCVLPWYVLDFDHRDPSTKIDEVSKLIKTSSWTRVLEEIEKCDLICACCHRLRTYKGNNSYRTRLYARNKQMIDALKEASPCLDCGVALKACQMDFDHVRGEKLGTVSQMLAQETSVLLSEIAKCDLVCANCHRARTYHRAAGSKKLTLSSASRTRQRASYQRKVA